MKKKSKINYMTFLSVLLFFICGFSLLLILYYIIFVAKGYYHADCTDTLMWAEAAYDAKALMNPDFSYACLLPFGGQLLMLPFVAIFGVGMKAQIIGMVLFYILFVLALIYLCKAIGFSIKWTAVMLTSVIIMLSTSEKLREIFWGHIIYYSLGILFLMIGAALVIKIIKSDNISKKDMILLLIWTALCSMNGVQALAIYALPVLAAVVAERFFDFKSSWSYKDNEGKYIVIILLIFGILIGYFGGKIVNEGIVAGYAEGYSDFSPISEWVGNLGNLFPSFMSLLGVTAEDRMLIYSMDGVVNLIKIFCSILLLVVPVIMAFMYKRFHDISYRLMILIHHFLIVLILLGWVFGRLSTANWRLSPIVVTSVILCVMFIKWIFKETDYKRLFVVIAIPISCVLFFATIDLITMEKQSLTNKRLNELAQYLEENNLEYGYATFWQANIITMISDSNVKVRGISLSESGYKKRLYQTNKNWYEDIEDNNKYFVILTEREMLEYYNNSDYNYETAQTILKYESYHILVYDQNIIQ